MRDIVFYTDYNFCSVIRNPDPDRNGVFLEIAPDRKCALLLLSNFASEKRQVSTSIRWDAAGFQPESSGAAVYKLCPGTDSPGSAEKYDSAVDFSLELPGNGTGGFLIGEKNTTAELIREFEKPYPAPSEELRAHFRLVEEQKKFREPSPQPVPELYMKLVMPKTHVPFVCGVAFHSLEHRIGFLDPDKGFVQLGYVSKKGFVRQKPTEAEWIWAEEQSPWISLRELFPDGGIYTVVVRSYGVSVGTYFHSLHETILSPVKDEHAPGARRLTYLNEVEPERENFHFSINLEKRN